MRLIIRNQATMATWQDSSKLIELRSKTDRQLIELINRKLETAQWFAADPEFHRTAERACEEVRHLLPWIPRPERRRIEARLDCIDARMHGRAHAACF